MKRKVYPVCEKCSTVINPKLHVDVAPGFVVNREVYCARCFKDDMQEQLEFKVSKGLTGEMGLMAWMEQLEFKGFRVSKETQELGHKELLG